MDVVRNEREVEEDGEPLPGYQEEDVGEEVEQVFR